MEHSVIRKGIVLYPNDCSQHYAWLTGALTFTEPVDTESLGLFKRPDSAGKEEKPQAQGHETMEK